MNLYGATAVVDGKPMAAFLIARDNDEAAAKAASRMPKGGKLTHIVFLCEARIGTMQRNRLYEFCPQSDQVEFACDAILRLLEIVTRQNNMLRGAVAEIHDVVINQFGMRRLSFVVEESNGVLQHHSCYHTDLEKAAEQAEQFARDHYGDGATITSIEEVTK